MLSASQRMMTGFSPQGPEKVQVENPEDIPILPVFTAARTDALSRPERAPTTLKEEPSCAATPCCIINVRGRMCRNESTHATARRRQRQGKDEQETSTRQRQNAHKNRRRIDAADNRRTHTDPTPPYPKGAMR